MPSPRVRALSLLVFALALVALRAAATQSLVPVASPAAAPRVTGVPEPAAAAALRRGERVDLNAASADDLALLPRVGPALAARIVADRRAHGAYASLADVGRVPGVGPRTLATLAPLVTVQRSKTSP